MKTNKFDICVIGGGLSGLLIARSLSGSGLSVVLLEKTDRLGGQLRASTSSVGPIYRDFGFLPANHAASAGLEFLKLTVGKDFTWNEETLAPVTFSKGQLHPFVGFGETAPPYVDELNQYLGDSRLSLSEPLSSLMRALETDLKAQVFFNAHVTGFDVAEEVTRAAVLDDGSRVEATAFIYCGEGRALLDQLPTEAYTQREIQKLVRTTLWTTICLDLVHPKTITNTKAVHLLTGTTKESLPCVGAFGTPFENSGQTLQTSNWMAFLDPEIEDEEAPAAALREMKRQIKRAYPEALDGLMFEKISLEPHSHGRLPMKVDAQSRWVGLNNFWLSKGYLSPQNGIVGALSQAEFVVTSVMTNLQAKSESAPTLEASL